MSAESTVEGTSRTTSPSVVVWSSKFAALTSQTASASSNPVQGSAPTQPSHSDSEEDIASDSDDGTETDLAKVIVPIEWLKLYRPRGVPNLGTQPPIHIGGTAGTGKTAFSLFLLHCLRKDYPDHAFVYRHGDVNPGCFIHFRGITVYHPSIVHAFSDGLLMKFLTCDFKTRIWTILDGAVAIPPGTPTANLIVLSPGLQTPALKQFLKLAITLVNPPWSLMDIEYVRTAAFPHLKKEDVAAAFKRWGGIPRLLLDYGNSAVRQMALNDSIYVRDLTTLFQQATAMVDNENVSGLHFHLIPGQQNIPDNEIKSDEAKFMFASYCWATTWLQDRFWQELEDRGGEERILRFLLDRTNDPTARAFAFEPHVFRTIQNTGFSGRVNLLDSSTIVTSCRPLKISQLERVTFSSFSELSTTPSGSHIGKFYVPAQTNHTSVDFYIPDNGMLGQITVGQKHGIKAWELLAALDSKIFDDWQLQHPGEKLKLIFICDGYIFENFNRQPYLSRKCKVLKNVSMLRKLDDLFEQFAWELDVDRQLKRHLNKPLRKKDQDQERVALDWNANKVEHLMDVQDKSKGVAVEAAESSSSSRRFLVPSKRSHDALDEGDADDN